MTIAIGDKLPDVKLVKSTEAEREPVQTAEYFKGKKVALFSVPGAFTPTLPYTFLSGRFFIFLDEKALFSYNLGT